MGLVCSTIMLLGFGCLLSAAVYAAVNFTAQLVWRWTRVAAWTHGLPPVTILKPLCGAEPGLYKDLKSFCEQDYPEYQIIFGVRDESDPACAVARTLAAELHRLPITVVVNSQLHGSNLKVSNLLNMLPYAKHELLVMADSDAFVEPNYLRAVAPPLQDPRVGLITCIYSGVPTPGIWSRLGAMYINDWYVPSVLLAWLFGHQGYVSGQTICIRQQTLHAVGGLDVLADHLADDNILGTFVHRLGLKIQLSRYVVTGEHHEPSLDSILRHEIRWMKTLRVLRPRSFRWLFLTFTLPLASVGLGMVLRSITRLRQDPYLSSPALSV
jgi:ceramide glucosyltransferase